MKYGTAEHSLNEAKKEIDKALEKIAHVRSEVGTIMEIKKVPSFPYYGLSHYYKGGYYNSFKPENRHNVYSAYENAQKAIAENLTDIEAIHVANAPALANNLETSKKIRDFMGAIGIPETYHVYELPSSRHKVKQQVAKSAGYRTDIVRCIPVTDGYDSSKGAAFAAQARLKKEYDTLIAAIVKVEQEAEKKAKADASIMELARFQVKYETMGDWLDILNIIITKDKYLRLGHFLSRNRADWSDGCDYAEHGINGFKVEDKVDEMIYNEIWGLIENWGGDGRCFRDCQSNYDYLFGIVVDRKLKEDYDFVKEKLDLRGKF